MFSRRTNWNLEDNRITRLLREKRRNGTSLTDLTESNPTQCGLELPKARLRDLLHADNCRYDPDPRGSLTAREAIAQLYARADVQVTPEQIFLTSGTSEAYSHLFRLLCNPGDSVFSPRPSYPLFEHLAQLADISLLPYDLHYDGEWHIEPDEIAEQVRPRLKGMILIHPHNPTGMLIRKASWERMKRVLEKRGSSLIADEVFSAYRFTAGNGDVGSFAANDSILTFTLNGLSKLAGLPQLKLGWIVVSGPASLRQEAMQRLEVITDAFLSVSTPVQNALPAILDAITELTNPIRNRITANLRSLHSAIPAGGPVTLLSPEGGWNAVLRLPDVWSDEEWCLKLLERENTVVHPGHYFEFGRGSYVVLSLLPDVSEFAEGISRINRVVSEAAFSVPGTLRG